MWRKGIFGYHKKCQKILNLTLFSEVQYQWRQKMKKGRLCRLPYPYNHLVYYFDGVK